MGSYTIESFCCEAGLHLVANYTQFLSTGRQYASLFPLVASIVIPIVAYRKKLCAMVVFSGLLTEESVTPTHGFTGPGFINSGEQEQKGFVPA